MIIELQENNQSPNLSLCEETQLGLGQSLRVKATELGVTEKHITVLRRFLEKLDIDTQLNEQINLAYKTCVSEDYVDPSYYWKKYYVDFPDAEIIRLVSVKEFAEKVMSCNDAQPILFSKQLAVGFIHTEEATKKKGTWQPHIYTCRLSSLSPIWRPKSESFLRKNQICNEYNDTFLETFLFESFIKTTNKHKLGSGWIGIIKENHPAMSTTLGGSRNPIKVDETLAIRWVHWSKQHEFVEHVTVEQIQEYCTNKFIRKADPYEKQSLRPE